MTLPEGTPLTVRTTVALSTNTHQAGQTFSAHLEDPVVYGGREIAAKGAEVEGRIVQADKGGRVKDRASLTVQLTGLHTTGGHVLEISTNSISREAGATKGKDAAKIGIGSGIGAAVGAIAGGRKGAAIGAAAGAGAGTGVVLATTGDPAVIPSETVLVFELKSAVLIAESRVEKSFGNALASRWTSLAGPWNEAPARDDSSPRSAFGSPSCRGSQVLPGRRTARRMMCGKPVQPRMTPSAWWLTVFGHATSRGQFFRIIHVT